MNHGAETIICICIHIIHVYTHTGTVTQDEYALSLYQQGSGDKNMKYWFNKHDLNSVRYGTGECKIIAHRATVS